MWDPGIQRKNIQFLLIFAKWNKQEIIDGYLGQKLLGCDPTPNGFLGLINYYRLWVFIKDIPVV